MSNDNNDNNDDPLPPLSITVITLEDLFNLLGGATPETGHAQVDRVVKDLEAEGFEGYLTHFCPNHFQAEFTNAATNEGAIVECWDLADPEAGEICRGDANLPTKPAPVALTAYIRPNVQ